jgi:hypothetical protein
MSVVALQSALRALRLNQSHVPWRAVARHLDGVALQPPGGAVQWADAWPHPDEWLRVRVDQRLAQDLLPRLRIQAQRDPVSAAKVAYLEALGQIQPLRDQDLRVALVHSGDGGTTCELVLDRVELALPRFVRWTLRVTDRAGRLRGDLLHSHADPRFATLVRMLTSQSASEALVALHALPDLEVDEVVRGEIGPARPGRSGPWVSAVLSRASPTLTGARVDDPVVDHVPGPESHHGFGLARHRKWAVPAADRAAATQWLRGKGSRNLVYGYR